MRPVAETPRRLAAPAFDPGSVWLVGAGPGDPGLLTLHAVSALERADIVLHDALVAPEILELVGPAARVEAVGKRAGRPGAAAQVAINERLIALARAGRRVLRLKGGDPTVFGRGGEEALALAAAGIPFRIVPGVTAGIGGLACAGMPATHRSLAAAVTLATGHGAGGGLPREVDWRAVARSSPVVVLYMALGTIGRIAAEFIAAGRAPDETVALVSDASTPRQTVLTATLATAGAAAARVARGAATLIVIGPVVGLAEVLGAWQQAEPMRVVPAPRLAALGTP